MDIADHSVQFFPSPMLCYAMSFFSCRIENGYDYLYLQDGAFGTKRAMEFFDRYSKV